MASTSELPVATDVLVVGAGPAGLALTTALALGGVDHLTIEEKPAVAPGTKAAGIQPRTLEYLDRLGVADDLVAAGLPGSGFAVEDGDDTLLRLDFGALDTPYPYLLLIGQDATEAALQRRSDEVGGRVARGYRLLDWQHAHPGVLATVAGPDGVVRVVRARHLVGADGVHSRVRESAGIAFEGTSPAALFALADVRFEVAPPGTDTAFFLSPEGVALVSALPGGLHRVVASVPPGTPAPTGDDVERTLATRAGGAFRGARVAEVVAASTYRFQQRVAQRLVDDPVVLLGDAAHTHSPAGGQGMNTGIQDAADLAWRLVEIHRHGADTALLDGFEAERRPVAEALIAFTGQLTALATLTDPAAAAVRNAVLGATGTLDDATAWLARRLSQLDIGYGDDPGVRPGNRLAPSLLDTAPSGPGWVLADPGAEKSDVVGRAEVIGAPDLPTTALVRPDGVVEAVGLTADDVDDHLARIGGAR